MNVALVPVKALGDGKSRMALDREAASALTLAMLEDVLGALAATDSVDRILTLTPDARVGELAQRCGAEAWIGPDAGLNPCLDQAQEKLGADATRLLVVLGDVAGAEPADLERMFEALHEQGDRGAVLAAARDGGTAALLRCPPDVIPNRFGRASAQAHRQAARAANVPFRELALPSLAVDLDCPEDAAQLLASPAPAPRTRQLLTELGIGSGSDS
jgi:2-phospho-L-lactate guanylyltransferase